MTEGDERALELVASAPRVIEPAARRPAGPLVGRRDAAVAVSGAVAAMTLAALVRRALPVRRRHRRRRRDVHVVGTRSFLIDVHVLRDP